MTSVLNRNHAQFHCCFLLLNNSIRERFSVMLLPVSNGSRRHASIISGSPAKVPSARIGDTRASSGEVVPVRTSVGMPTRCAPGYPYRGDPRSSTPARAGAEPGQRHFIHGTFRLADHYRCHIGRAAAAPAGCRCRNQSLRCRNVRSRSFPQIAPARMRSVAIFSFSYVTSKSMPRRPVRHRRISR